MGDAGMMKGVYFLKIKALVHFDSQDNDPTATTPIESSPAFMSSSRDGTAPAYDAPNNLGNITT